MEALDKISGEIGRDESITVNLLVEVNFLKALQPLQVIPSQEDGRYAIRTARGCYVK